MSGVFDDGFQIIVSPHTAAIIEFQDHTAIGEVERGDDADRAERMPLLVHAVARPLRRDRETVELSRQADGEVGDVDHLLDFALTLCLDLPHLECDEGTERLPVLAQQVSDDTDVLAALRGGHHPPRFEGVGGGRDDLLVVGTVGAFHRADTFTRRRVLDFEFGATGLEPFTGVGTGADVFEIEGGED